MRNSRHVSQLRETLWEWVRCIEEHDVSEAAKVSLWGQILFFAVLL